MNEGSFTVLKCRSYTEAEINRTEILKSEISHCLCAVIKIQHYNHLETSYIAQLVYARLEAVKWLHGPVDSSACMIQTACIFCDVII